MKLTKENRAQLIELLKQKTKEQTAIADAESSKSHAELCISSAMHRLMKVEDLLTGLLKAHGVDPTGNNVALLAALVAE